MKRVKMVLVIVCSFILTLAFYGCGVSSEERKERRANAFDISGSYRNSSVASKKVKVRVDNESGKHDVVVTVERDGFTKEELSLFSRYNLDVAKIETKYGKRIELGKGKDPLQNGLDGGENFSQDFGKTSSVRVYGDAVKLKDGMSVSYSLSVEISKQDLIMRGYLSVNIHKTSIINNPDGTETLQIENVGDIKLRFYAENPAPFYKQYLGIWRGGVELNTLSSSTLKGFTSLQISKDASNIFRVSSGIKVLQYLGKNYQLKDYASEIRDLKEYNKPGFELQYVGKDGTIKLYGHIRSLGNMTGSIIHITIAGKEKILGSFKFQKH